jgi:hypothetical protein
MHYLPIYVHVPLLEITPLATDLAANGRKQSKLAIVNKEIIQY